MRYHVQGSAQVVEDFSSRKAVLPPVCLISTPKPYCSSTVTDMASLAISVLVLALSAQSALGRGLLQMPVSGAANATAAATTVTATSGAGSLYCQVLTGSRLVRRAAYSLVAWLAEQAVLVSCLWAALARLQVLTARLPCCPCA